MKKFLCMSIAIVMLLCAVSTAYSRDTYVRGHTRRDGTHVQPHYRTSPNSTRNDNYSTRGNINPYTGQHGTQHRDYGYRGGRFGVGLTVTEGTEIMGAAIEAGKTS